MMYKTLFCYLCSLLGKVYSNLNSQKVKKIKSALISVYYKDGLEPIVRRLAGDSVKKDWSGGTL